MANTDTLVESEAPDFSVPNKDGEIRTLADYSGKWLVLYAYPKDNTPGCTLEAMDFTRMRSEFESVGAIVVGVSPDSPKKHCNFTDKHDLSLELLSDEDHRLLEAYGAWSPKKLYGREFLGVVRSTFLIDPEGIVRKVWRKVKVTGHAAEVLQTIKDLS